MVLGADFGLRSDFKVKGMQDLGYWWSRSGC